MWGCIIEELRYTLIMYIPSCVYMCTVRPLNTTAAITVAKFETFIDFHNNGTERDAT